MTAPENIPNMMQKPMADGVEFERVQRIRTSREETIWVTMCMFSGPVLSEKLAMVIRPMVDAPFMMVRSQKVCKGFESASMMWIGT